MENFREISNRLKDYCNEKDYLGVEEFSNKINKKSYLNVYSNIEINKLHSIKLNVSDFLSYYEDKKIKGDFKSELIFKNILSSFVDLNYKFDLIVEMDKKISILKSNISKVKKVNDYLKISDENKNQFEKRQLVLKIKIKELSKELNESNKKNKILKNEVINFIKSLDDLKDIYLRSDENKNKFNMSAETFVDSLNKSKLLNFLNSKIDCTKWEFTKSQKFEEVLFFADKSIAVKENGNYKAISPIGINYNEVSKDIAKSIVSFIYRKKPNYIEKVYKLLEIDNFNLENMKNMSETFMNNENILKNVKFNFIEELNNSIKKLSTLECIDDNMNKLINEYKVNKLANSILSNKYKNLYNKKTNDLFKELYELKVDESFLQNSIGRKIASFKSPAELNRGLQLFIDSMNDFDILSIKKKAEKLNCNICIENETSIVLRINDFVASKNLGSQSWCISRTESYFDSYTDKDSVQYFYFDFDKFSKDNKSMIGFTINKYGELTNSHVKNDDEFDFEKINKKIYHDVLRKDIKLFNLSKELEELISVENKKYQIKNKI